jgi:subtilisin family serine protease
VKLRRWLTRSFLSRASSIQLLVLLGLASVAGRAAAEAWSDKVDPVVLEAAAGGNADFLVVLTDQADVRNARHLRQKQDRGRWVYESLQRVALRAQIGLLATLRALGVEHRAFWIVNMIQVNGDLTVVERLARDKRVARIVENAPLRREAPRIDPSASLDSAPRAGTAVTGVEWNVAKVNAPAVWAQGITGQGAVVGGMDTGYDWNHPALRSQYRGWNRDMPRHDYNWHDAIHRNGSPNCPSDSPEPCDAQGHGTHTMGTALGDDGVGNQIGVAPGAKWMGCRCWEPEFGTRLSYVTECFEWFVAPTDMQGANPAPLMAPHAITNSWVCDALEGCTDPNVLRQVVENVRAAGIVVVAGAGNAGPDCSSVFYPPAIYEASFSVGATTSTDAIAAFSSRGPVFIDESDRMKPDLSAPGQSVRSSVPGNGFEGGWNGTSMATPHVSGAVALLVSAVPELAGQVEEIEDILRSTAVPLTTNQGCGGDLGSDVPNNVFGAGRLDVWAAYQEALSRRTAIGEESPEKPPDAAAGPQAAVSRLLSNRPNPFNPGTRITFEVGTISRVTLDLYDIAGRHVRRVVSQQHDPGVYSVVWDGRDQHGRSAPSGMYLVRFAADGVKQSRRVVLLR